MMKFKPYTPTLNLKPGDYLCWVKFPGASKEPEPIVLLRCPKVYEFPPAWVKNHNVAIPEKWVLSYIEIPPFVAEKDK